MSHFAVMVIGPDVEAQLQPFHEFECTGEDDEYVQEIDITDEVLSQFKTFVEEGSENPLQDTLEYYGLEDYVADPKEIELGSSHKYGYAIVRDGKLVKAIDRTNPNKKWDWWQVGGRWHGFLKLKHGAEGETGEPGLMTPEAKQGWVDCARKGDVDWDGMRDDAANEAAQRYDRVRELAPEDWEPWESVRERFSNIEDARTFYHSQAEVQAAQKEGFWEPDSFLASRESYIDRARAAAVAPFAILHNGEWLERGEMGWWGIVTNDSGKDSWVYKAWEILESVSDDELITVVDCHI